MNVRRSAKPKPSLPAVSVKDTNWQRSREYGECTAALVINPTANGAEALFNQALSNGLAAIVNHRWPGKERRRSGQVKSATELLKFIGSKVHRRGNICVLQGQTGKFRWRTAISIKLLTDGIQRTDPVRHGLPGSALEKVHIDALVKLDSHPSLQSIRDELRDEAWVQMVAEDREARMRALKYVRSLSEDEWARRQDASYMDDYQPFDPKEAPYLPGIDVCPVCWLETFVNEEMDDFGFGIGSGTCRACSYTRTPEMAEDEAIDAKIHYELGKDD